MVERECDICGIIRNEDLVILRDDDFIVVHSPKPFNNGHLVVAPLRHVSINELDDYSLARLFIITKKLVDLLQRVYSPHGFNIDIVPSPHMHIQIVPRWEGDISFVALFHGLKTVPESLRDSVEKLRRAVMEYGT